MILSAPHLTHTPSCLDENSSADSACICLAIQFATKRRKTSHTAMVRTAMVRTPPFTLFKAIKEAPQKTGATDRGS